LEFKFEQGLRWIILNLANSKCDRQPREKNAKIVKTIVIIGAVLLISIIAIFGAAAAD